MLVKCALNSSSLELSAIIGVQKCRLQSACQLHTPSNLETFVALCCVTKLHILEWPFYVPSTRWTCVMIMLFHQLLDTCHLSCHLSCRWIILVKEKCSLTGQNMRAISLWDLLFQLMKHGTNTLHVAFYIFVQCSSSPLLSPYLSLVVCPPNPSVFVLVILIMPI